MDQLRNELEREKQGNWDLENSRATLEQEKEGLLKRLNTLEQNWNQEKENNRRLTIELQQSMEQTSAVLEEKASALSQVAQLNSKLEKVHEKRVYIYIMNGCIHTCTFCLVNIIAKDLKALYVESKNF